MNEQHEICQDDTIMVCSALDWISVDGMRNQGCYAWIEDGTAKTPYDESCKVGIEVGTKGFLAMRMIGGECDGNIVIGLLSGTHAGKPVMCREQDWRIVEDEKNAAECGLKTIKAGGRGVRPLGTPVSIEPKCGDWREMIQAPTEFIVTFHNNNIIVVGPRVAAYMCKAMADALLFTAEQECWTLDRVSLDETTTPPSVITEMP
jgi:hypothetical protein